MKGNASTVSRMKGSHTATIGSKGALFYVSKEKDMGKGGKKVE
jgi:hypothetical protein